MESANSLLPMVLLFVLVVLVVILAIVGVQLVLTLIEFRKTLKHVNNTLDTVDTTVAAITTPLQNLGGMASGLSTGFRVFETFVGWLNRNKEDEL